MEIERAGHPLVKLIKESISSEGIHPKGWKGSTQILPSLENIIQFLLTEAQFWEVTIKEAENYNWVFGIEKLYRVFLFLFFLILNSP